MRGSAPPQPETRRDAALVQHRGKLVAVLAGRQLARLEYTAQPSSEAASPVHCCAGLRVPAWLAVVSSGACCLTRNLNRSFQEGAFLRSMVGCAGKQARQEVAP